MKFVDYERLYPLMIFMNVKYLLLINYYNIIHIFITMSKKVAKKPQAEK